MAGELERGVAAPAIRTAGGRSREGRASPPRGQRFRPLGRQRCRPRGRRRWHRDTGRGVLNCAHFLHREMDAANSTGHLLLASRTRERTCTLLRRWRHRIHVSPGSAHSFAPSCSVWEEVRRGDLTLASGRRRLEDVHGGCIETGAMDLK